jgi:methyl coenzyme M reductase subunit C-like uncharacterized protein (methanogenesis marker protein 7)
MRLSEFEELAEHAMLEIIKDQGVYIGKIKSKGKTSLLYQVDGFYVELTYVKYRHSIAHIRCFDSTKNIDGYIKQINLEFLNQPFQ